MSHQLYNEEIPEAVHKEIEKLDEIKKRQNGQIQDLKTKSIQQANLFFIFQGVILMSLTFPTSSFSCHNWWIPFVLSLLAAALNLFSFHGTIKTFLACSEEIDQLLEDYKIMRVHNLTRAQISLAKPGSQIPIKEVPSSSRNKGDKNEVTRLIIRSIPPHISVWKRRAFAYLGLAGLVAFSGVVLYACQDILCSRTNSNCVKLC